MLGELKARALAKLSSGCSKQQSSSLACQLPCRRFQAARGPLQRRQRAGGSEIRSVAGAAEPWDLTCAEAVVQPLAAERARLSAG